MRNFWVAPDEKLTEVQKNLVKLRKIKKSDLNSREGLDLLRSFAIFWKVYLPFEKF